MITPEQANALKPVELMWLRETEARIDSVLRDKFGGGPVEIRVREMPPLDRTFLVLIGQYERAGWDVGRYQRDGYELLIFRSRVPVAPPRYEASGMKQVNEVPVVEETVKTAWERINVEDT